MSQITPPREFLIEGCPGLVAENLNTKDARTGVSSSEMFYGRLVVDDSAAMKTEDGVKHPAAAFTEMDVIGVVSSTHAIESSRDDLDAHYPAKRQGNILRSGYIWVAITEDIAIGDPVHVLTAAGDEGKFAMSGGEVLANARWKRGGSATEGIALLEIKYI